MMKKINFLLVFLTAFISCEHPSQCVESTGEIITKNIDVTPFTRLEVHRGIAVVVTQGANYEVQIKTGANLMNDIEVTQDGTNLIMKDNTTCNWVREYGQTTVYVTAPNLTEIYSKTERDISSNGVLSYPSLTLQSHDTNGDHLPGAGTGDFHLTINNNFLDIENNNVSRYYLSGTTNTLNLHFWAGDGRVEAQNLVAQFVNIYDRSSNDLIVNPIQSISGSIVSTGNVIAKNHPTTVNVNETYQGHLLFE